MKPFDFAHQDFLRHQESVRNWFKEHYHKPVTEDEYVAAMRGLRKDGHGKRVRRNRCPSNLRRNYRALNEKFGFFLETTNKEDK